MKAAHSDQKDNYVYSVYMGTTPVKKLYMGNTLIWPDNANRITRITVDFSPVKNTNTYACWQVALERLQAAGVSSSTFIKLLAGRTYMVNQSNGSLNIAHFNGSDAFEFDWNQGPISSALRVGSYVTITMQIPSFDSNMVHYSGGSGGIDNTNTYYGEVGPIINGCYLMGASNKGRKKECAGMEGWAYYLPSGNQAAYGTLFHEGHCRWGFDTCKNSHSYHNNLTPAVATGYTTTTVKKKFGSGTRTVTTATGYTGTLTYQKGSTGTRLAAKGRSSVEEFAVWLRYPTISFSFQVRVTSITTQRVEDDLT
jgi:hypothetical protein